MSSPQNVEMEAAKFLHKLIQESKDEPAKLATKLCVILQHMKSSGKEHSMPYQVISRAMETVINQNGLDIEALKSSRLPLASSSQTGDSTMQYEGSLQAVGVTRDPKAGSTGNEMAKTDAFASSRPPVGPNSVGHDIYQGSVPHRSGKSFDHESPSSLDSRSTNSQRDTTSWDKQASLMDDKKSSGKRKRADSSLAVESHVDNLQSYDSGSSAVNPRKGKLMNKVEPPGNFSVKGHSTKVQGGMLGDSRSFPVVESGFASATQCSNSSYNNHGLFAKMHMERSIEALSAASSPSVELSSSRGAVNSEHWKHGYMKGVLGNSSEKLLETNLFSGNRGEEASASLSTGKVVEHDGGIPNALSNTNNIVQGGGPNFTEMNMLRSIAPRDNGKSPISQAPSLSVMPFKEQHLKQLRAQCLVFLAFRNGLMPKKLHLEIALGNIFSKEGSSADSAHKELSHPKGKEQSLDDPSIIPEGTVPVGRINNAREIEGNPSGSSSTGNLQEADLRGATNSKKDDRSGPPSDPSVFAEERKHLLASSRKLETEMQVRETLESQAFLSSTLQPDYSSVRASAVSNREADMESGVSQVGRDNQSSSIMGITNQMNPAITNWTGIGSNNGASRGPLPASRESVPDRMNNVIGQSESLGDCNVQANPHADSQLSAFPLRDHWKPISGMDSGHQSVLPVKDTNVLLKHVSQDDLKVSQIQKRMISDGCKTVCVDETLKTGSLSIMEGSRELEDEEKSLSSDLPPSPKYTTSEKWILDQQKRKILVDQNWKLKQKKTDQRIAACYNTLKETVSSSEDISAKTKSVIELKKLQLLELQRRLRSGFLNDFFRPIAADTDRLKSMKKHRHGRRIRQLEKFEQKMKEERQKRIRERQKEFFGEIEVHKERLDDVFKIRRERWKNLNKYVKEFHKRKERIHREKIDRIQREKINLLKINDVEGYLRMVQDAKSDRVKQLLKETEKYLQKLGSKLQEAKTISKRFELDTDESLPSSIVENSEAAVENDDESDQAKHYLESNEKYYLMAHSIKESIAEQPTCLQGGKLREYQLNGLRWLVSLYNNHLNGILADEMGLGKTVQVISLICYLMETKNDRGPFLVVVPSSVLPGWESEINFWAPSIKKIVYAGPPEERRRLFKERIIQQKFNVLLTTYEYLMNKHDRPKLSKLHWHYIIIDEGHRIKNASCKLNADLKHYQSSHRLLLTGTPLQNNLEELWALLNFLLPNIFNSSEDFSQWFNKPFEGNGDNSADQALLSEEENLLIINRLHQVLRPFVLRRLKHKVENELPEKIERLVRCEASAYQKILMKRVEDNLGSLGNSKGRSVHNSVMELRNICNHPYLSQLHAEEVDNMMPKHYLPTIVRLCGKLEMLDRLLPKLKATDHRVLFFSTMTRLLDVMEDYLHWKQYPYLRLDGHTSGGDRGALIDKFNRPNSPFFIFLLSIRAGGVGVNLQAADTVIIFDTDWNPQVDLQAQARAHRIGQKKDVLVLRLETVHTVEEQVRASAEHKLGVANQSITAGFFDNNTSAEDRREYLESLLRECKKEEAAPVLNDDGLNDLLARSESEIDVFESIDKQRQEGEMEIWKKLILGPKTDSFEPIPPLPSRLVTDDDLKPFCEAMKKYEVPKAGVVSSNAGEKRKSEYLGGLDTKQYGRGKRAREVRSYEEQWTEEEFEKICQADSPDSPKPKEEVVETKFSETKLPSDTSNSLLTTSNIEPSPPPPPPLPPPPPPPPTIELPPVRSEEVTPPSKRGRGRPKRVTSDISPSRLVLPSPGSGKLDLGSQQGAVSTVPLAAGPSTFPSSTTAQGTINAMHQAVVGIAPSSHLTFAFPPVAPGSHSTPPCPSVPKPVQGQNRRTHGGGEAPRRRGKKQVPVSPALPVSDGLGGLELKVSEQPQNKTEYSLNLQTGSNASVPLNPGSTTSAEVMSGTVQSAVGIAPSSQPGSLVPPRRRGKKQVPVSPALPVSDGLGGLELKVSEQPQNKTEYSLNLQTGSNASVPLTPGSTTSAEVMSGTVQSAVGIAPSSQPGSLVPSVAPPSQPTPAPSVPMQVRGHQKTQSRAEAPRRRGRKRGPVTEQKDSFLVNKQLTRSSGTTQDSPGKNSTLLKVTEVDAPLKSKEGILVAAMPAIQTCRGPVAIQTADSSDVAPVVKYVLSEAGSLLTKVGKCCGSESGDAENIPLSSQSLVVRTNNQTLEGETYSAMSTLDSAPPGFDRPIHKNEDQSSEGGDVNVKGVDDPVLQMASETKIGECCGSKSGDTPDISVPSQFLVEVNDGRSSDLEDKSCSTMQTLEPAPPGFDLPIHKMEDQSGGGGDPEVQKSKDPEIDKVSQTKTGTSCGSEVDIPSMSIISQSFFQATNAQTSDNKTYSDFSTLEKAPPGFDLPIQEHEDQFKKEGDANAARVKDPVLLETASQTKIEAPVGSVKAYDMEAPLSMAPADAAEGDDTSSLQEDSNADAKNLGVTCEGEDKKDKVLEPVDSIAPESCNLDPLSVAPADAAEGDDTSSLQEDSNADAKNLEVTREGEDKKDKVLEPVDSITPESCNLEPVKEDLGVQPSTGVESAENGDDGVCDMEVGLPEKTEFSPSYEELPKEIEVVHEDHGVHKMKDLSGGGGDPEVQKSTDPDIDKVSHTKTGTSCGSEVDIPSMSIISQSFLQVTNAQNSENKMYSDFYSLEKAPPGFDLPIQEHEDQFKKEGHATVERVKDPVLLVTASQTKIEAPVGSVKAQDMEAPLSVAPAAAAEGDITSSLQEDSKADAKNLEVTCEGEDKKDKVLEPVDSITPCNLEPVKEDHGVQPSNGVESAENGDDGVRDMEVGLPEKPEFSPYYEELPKEIEAVQEDHGVQLPTGGENMENEADGVCKMEVDQSEKQEYSLTCDEWPKDTEVIQGDHEVQLQTGGDSTENEADGVSKKEVNTSEKQESSPNVISNFELPDDTNVEKSDLMEEVSQIAEVAAETSSANMFSPSYSSVAEEANIENSPEKEPVGTIATVEELKGSEDSVGGLTILEETKGSEDPVGSLATLEDSKGSEDPVGSLATIGELVVSEDPVGSLGTINELKGFEDSVGNLAILEESKGSEDPVGSSATLDESNRLAALEESKVSEDPVGSSATLDESNRLAALEESKVSEDPVGSSATLEELNGSEDPVDRLTTLEESKGCED